MTFANRGTVHFATDQDRVEPSSVPLTNAATETGIKSVQCSSNQWWDENLMMQHTYHTAQCMHEHWLMPLSNALITYRMRQLERELEAREKEMKSVKPNHLLWWSHDTNCRQGQAIEYFREMCTWEEKVFELEMKWHDTILRYSRF